MKNIYEPSYYQILCVNEDATPKQLKSAWRGQQKIHHEDKNNGTDAAKKRSQLLNEAYEILRKPESRAQYDSDLRQYRHAKTAKQNAREKSSEQTNRSWNFKEKADFQYRPHSSGDGWFLFFLLLAKLFQDHDKE